MPPPQLTRDTPGLNIFQPVVPSALKLFRVNLETFFFDSFNSLEKEEGEEGGGRREEGGGRGGN